MQLGKVGLLVERSHHEVGTAGQMEINYRFADILHAGDDVMKFKYVIRNTAWQGGKTATFMPKPLFGDNGSGMHVHQSLWKDGKPLFFGNGYGDLSDLARHYVVAFSSMPHLCLHLLTQPLTPIADWFQAMKHR